MSEPLGTTSGRPFEARHRVSARSWLVVFLVALLLYVATANRGPQWQDSGSQILRILTGSVLHPAGLALSHPLHYWLGRLAILPGMLAPCFAVTLVSSVAAAVAVACVYGCVLTLTGRKSAALFAAASLGIANTFWHLATLTEIYTLGAALLAGECWCLALFARSPKRGWLWGLLFLNGLGIANHLQAALTTPVLVVVVIHALVKARVRPLDVLCGVILWLIGTLPYSGLVLAQWLATGDFTGTLASALFGDRFGGNVLNAALSPRVLVVALAFPLYNFPNLLLPAAAYGLGRVRHLDPPRVVTRALLAGLVIHLTFVVRYSVVDQHTFFLPSYVILSIFGGIGAARIWQWSSRAWARRTRVIAVVLLALTPVSYAVFPALARHYHVLEQWVGDRHRPYRNEYEYLLVPWSVCERSAERLTTEALNMAGLDGLIVVETTMAVPAIEYARLQSGHEDLQVRLWLPNDRPEYADVPEVVRRAVAKDRPVVLVPHNANEPRLEPPVGKWQRRGDLYLLVGENEDAPKAPRNDNRRPE